jgi:hypothetical protein
MNKIIESFYNQISWSDECKIELIGDTDVVSTNLVLYMPCDWVDAESLSEIIIDYAKMRGLEPGLIIGGNPNPAIAERLCFVLTKQGILVSFIDPIARIAQSRFMISALDGLDWGRTSESIATGNSAPVWSWDV